MVVATFGFEPAAPQGTIVMWDRPLSEIPSGWLLCDGNNGTVNMLDKFPRGETDGTLVGNTGGRKSFTLSSQQLPAHKHDATTNNEGAHYHIMKARGLDDYDSSDQGPSSAIDDYYYTTKENGSHSHNVQNIDKTGGGSSIDNQPSYYEVAFIQKI